MVDPAIIDFVREAIAAGVIGSAAYEGIKAILGGTFNILKAYSDKNDAANFEETLYSALEENKHLEEQLNNLHKNVTITQNQSHSGIGDNVGRDKTEIHHHHESQPVSKYKLTDNQKNVLRALVEIGKTWSEEFTMTWNGNESDILGYDGTPPQISERTIHVLEKNGLISCDFNIAGNAEISLTDDSYEAVETNFGEGTDSKKKL